MDSLIAEIDRLPDHRTFGRVAGIQGLLVAVGGLFSAVSIGTRVSMAGRRSAQIAGEVVGFKDGRALVMPFGSLDGIGLGAKTIVADHDAVVYPHPTWLGRVVNALGEPIDGGPPLPQGPQGMQLRASAPIAARTVAVR